VLASSAPSADGRSVVFVIPVALEWWNGILGREKRKEKKREAKK